MKDFLITILAFIVMLGIIFLIIFITANADKKRCEQNGGKYIWEWSYGSKCHLKD